MAEIVVEPAHPNVLLVIGHQWLVPEDLRFRNSRGDIGMLSQRDIVARQFDDVSLAGPPLIGRGGGEKHWSTYFQGDGSPLDGVKWDIRGSDQRVTRWDQVGAPSRPISMDTSPDYPNGPPFARPRAHRCCQQLVQRSRSRDHRRARARGRVSRTGNEKRAGWSRS